MSKFPIAPKHRNPIPTCVMLGNLILPSVISGHDPKAPGVKSDAQKQSEQAFINMNEIVEAPGGTTDGIGKVILYLKNFKHRELVNEQWLKMFADETIGRRAT